MQTRPYDSPRLFTAQQLDIGFRCKVTQSSGDRPGYKNEYLYPSLKPGGFFFHTEIEDQPWIIVDLGGIRTIGGIKIWNREEMGQAVADRALPLSICLSSDGVTWRNVNIWKESFGGRLSGRPLNLSFASGLKARHVRFRALEKTALHFDYVEILQYIPALKYGFSLIREKIDNEIECQYFHCVNEGLYSSFSTILHDTRLLIDAGMRVSQINLTSSFRFFKNDFNRDVFYDFFRDIDHPKLLEYNNPPAFRASDTHEVYSRLPLSGLKLLASCLLAPSIAVEIAERRMTTKAGLDSENTIAIVYRGTDKSTELEIAPISSYIEIAERIKKRHPELQIFIQTDQAQAREEVAKAFSGDIFFFEDLPVTTGSRVIHQQLEINKDEFTINMIAAVLFSSKCRFVITHTGNIGAWICIYRGSTERVFQFDSSGDLIPPIGYEDFSKTVLATYENFDENAYLRGNPDIALSLNEGKLSSGFEHFKEAGVHEGRKLRFVAR